MRVRVVAPDKKSEKDAPLAPAGRPGQSAFLGQQIWDQTLSLDLLGDFKDFELEYMDLDEFFNVSTWTSTSSSM